MPLPFKKETASIVYKIRRKMDGMPEDYNSMKGDNEEVVISANPDQDYEPGLQSAAMELISAMKRENVDEVVKHLKRFMEMCQKQEKIEEKEM